MTTTSKEIVRIPPLLPPLPQRDRWSKHLPASTAFKWLRCGWIDFWKAPASSLFFGALVFLASVAFVGGLVLYEADYILFPAFAGFLVVGPILAVGLYEKSRRIAAGKSFSILTMIFVRPRSGGQLLFTGVLLCLLLLLWMRAAVIVYALFFGLRPFPGIDDIAPMLFTTPTGWAMLFVGGCVGALFAAFSFAISFISIPMLLDQRVDALTAMGRSLAVVANNLPVTLTWGAIVLALFLFSLATGMLGLILVFPVIGHGTWHAYRSLNPAPEA